MYRHFQLKSFSQSHIYCKLLTNTHISYMCGANEMARTRYKHFKSVVICQCELKVVFLSLDLFADVWLYDIASTPLARRSFMRPVLLLYYIWYYENLMIHWAHPRGLDWNHIHNNSMPEFHIEKLPMIKFNTFTKATIWWERGKQWARYVWSKTSTDFAFIKRKTFKLYLEELKVMRYWKIVIMILFVYLCCFFMTCLFGSLENINSNLIAFMGWIILEEWGN